MDKPKITATSLKRINNYDPADYVNIKQNINVNKDIIEYGDKNSFPNDLLDTVKKSHTCNSCIDTRASFLEGVLNSQSLADTIVNSDGESFSAVHHKVSMDYSYFEGAYLHFLYNLNGKITNIQHLPFEYCRLAAPNEFGKITHIKFNPYFGTTDYKEEEDQTFPIFNPDERVVKAQLEAGSFNGQIMFIKEERPGSRFYPIPYYWSGQYWYDIERKIGEFHNANIDNNFMLSLLIKFVGDPDQAVETDKDGKVTKTLKKAVDEQLSNQFSGKDKGGVAMTVWGDSKEAFPEIEAFPTNTHDSMFTALQELIYENVSIATNIPPSLANIQVAGKLGNTDEIENSVRLLQGKVQKSQGKLEDSYDKIFINSIWGVQDTTISPFEYSVSKQETLETENPDNEANIN